MVDRLECKLENNFDVNTVWTLQILSSEAFNFAAQVPMYLLRTLECQRTGPESEAYMWYHAHKRLISREVNTK